MQDGYTQVGAGDSDMRVASNDLQHGRQPRTADEAHMPIRRVHQSAGSGGPMKEALTREIQQHAKGRSLRLDHLQKNYMR